MRLRELRKINNLTQKDLGKKMGVSAQTILNWENNVYQPSVNELIKLADIFNVSLDYLVNRERNNNIDDIKKELAKMPQDILIEIFKEALDNYLKSSNNK